MKDFLIYVLIIAVTALAVFMVMSGKTDSFNQPYQFNSEPATVIYHTPEILATVPAIVQPTAIPTNTQAPPPQQPEQTPTVEYNPLTAQDYGLPVIGPYSLQRS